MRSYTIKAIKYIAKNFFYLLPFAVLPAFLLAMSVSQSDVECVIKTILSGDLTNIRFDHVFNAISLLNFSSWESIVFGALGVVVLLISVSVLMALLEKHMRIGRRTFHGIFSKLNDNLIPTFGYMVIVLIIYEIWSLITAGLLFLFSKIPVVWLAYTLSGIFFVALHIALIYVLGIIYLWLPCMQITGFRALEAFQYSYQLMAPVRWGILGVQALLLFVVEGLLGVCALFSMDAVTFTLLTTAIYALVIMVYCVRMEIVYFDRENMRRADEKRY